MLMKYYRFRFNVDFVRQQSAGFVSFMFLFCFATAKVDSTTHAIIDRFTSVVQGCFPLC